MFGKRLPASGLFFWHVNGLTLENVAIDAVKPDERPSMIFRDVEGLKVDGKIPSVESLSVGSSTPRGDDLNVPPEQIEGGSPTGMTCRYLLRQAEKTYQRWRTDYESRKTPEQIAAYQKRPTRKC